MWSLAQALMVCTSFVKTFFEFDRRETHRKKVSGVTSYNKILRICQSWVTGGQTTKNLGKILWSTDLPLHFLSVSESYSSVISISWDWDENSRCVNSDLDCNNFFCSFRASIDFPISTRLRYYVTILNNMVYNNIGK